MWNFSPAFYTNLYCSAFSCFHFQRKLLNIFFQSGISNPAVYVPIKSKLWRIFCWLLLRGPDTIHWRVWSPASSQSSPRSSQRLNFHWRIESRAPGSRQPEETTERQGPPWSVVSYYDSWHGVFPFYSKQLPRYLWINQLTGRINTRKRNDDVWLIWRPRDRPVLNMYCISFRAEPPKISKWGFGYLHTIAIAYYILLKLNIQVK